MPLEFSIHLGRAVPDRGGPPQWIGRTYTADGEHIHSSEGGTSLGICVAEAQRAIGARLAEQDKPETDA